MAQPLPAAISGRGGRRGGARREEGSGDSEQDAVTKWNVIIFRKCNIARDLPQVYYTSSNNRAHS